MSLNKNKIEQIEIVKSVKKGPDITSKGKIINKNKLILSMRANIIFVLKFPKKIVIWKKI